MNDAGGKKDKNTDFCFSYDSKNLF